ncbi:MAG TPA: NAD(P)-dependent alcohol dehydrogenase [Pseudomonas sp.]|jgi:alcohol dehydrogenase (NADP+)|uniref:Alcohol dehydrogenase catalytic domain-containing protein n=1 Tax=Pseudomonas helleri TaxID=1608996 RepID=A0A0J6ICY2_9PSED|nr:MULTISPECIES: NAD(P)-dependent alcohol dehydrogenase [Pseudomonas]KMN10132.1 hydroxyacid dehydrogenase [Pseudomonas helleri]MCU1753331.1 NAD(P)-dependent alcohol dehydrogenase [Pseudomonas helleri]MQT31804.1 alcohol dehydrogenase catalytic domain-containing protein [Pseudomonas helleri]MQT34768.1 alcohol dehydrogenase catalytic domain-containing protein [Pseudomonas helleri]MQT41308.1 alcohol dehydrogenase catalytic domain-containing protein [Pseudomonas sp. FSL R10-0765]
MSNVTYNAIGYAAQTSSAPLAPMQFNRRAPRPDDVAIEVLYCGVCHSDIHQARNEWGFAVYPVMPGHEIVGKVTAIGDKVTKHKVGDLVGVGCMVDSCRECSACKEDLEQYCLEGATMTYCTPDRVDGTNTMGGYSDSIVVSEHFVVRIPENLDPASAAPLLCAGITTYSPLQHYGVEAGDKVGVLGMGGLGHMGIKFAKAMGAEVTLFTRSAAKAEEAYKQGADHVIVSTDPEQMKAAADRFDFLLDTIPVPHDLNPYLETLRFDGVHILVGLIEPVDPALDAFNLVFKRRVLAGSLIGGIAETQEMLDFSAANGITCDIEMLDIKNINEAFERVVKGDVKYRFVIDMKTLKA